MDSFLKAQKCFVYVVEQSQCGCRLLVRIMDYAVDCSSVDVRACRLM
jgi:hypothetical protein